MGSMGNEDEAIRRAIYVELFSSSLFFCYKGQIECDVIGLSY